MPWREDSALYSYSFIPIQSSCAYTYQPKELVANVECHLQHFCEQYG